MSHFISMLERLLAASVRGVIWSSFAVSGSRYSSSSPPPLSSCALSAASSSAEPSRPSSFAPASLFIV